MQITLRDQEVSFQLRVSERAHGVYLKISRDEGLEVIIPRHYHLHKIPKLLEKKERWILRNLEKISHQKKHQQAFGDGMNISIFGTMKTLRIKQPARETAGVHETENEIIVEGSDTISASRTTLERYLRHRARHFFGQRVEEMSVTMGTHVRSITVRAQKSRWGSCNRSNDLNFNWRLVLMPLEVIEYVIIHELAHTFHHNHSKRFYGVLEKYCPDYKKRRKLLREQQDILPL